MRRHARWLAAVLAAAAVALAGCSPLGAMSGSANGAGSSRSPATAAQGGDAVSRAPSPTATGGDSSRAAVAVAQATHEYPGPAVHERASSAWTDPVVAVQAFASAYINWTASTVSSDLRRLAAASIGQARSAMALAAAQTAQDDELARGGVANAGSVEAIAPLGASTTQFVVVTLERTTATATDAYQGLAAAWHVALATVSEVSPGRWVVSGWQPES